MSRQKPLDTESPIQVLAYKIAALREAHQFLLEVLIVALDAPA